MLGGTPAALRALGIDAAGASGASPALLLRLGGGGGGAATAAAQAAVSPQAAVPKAAATASEAAAAKAGGKKEKPPKPAKGGAAAAGAAAKVAAAAPARPATPAPVARTLPAGAPLRGDNGAETFSCISYNVLMPNSSDGWWIYKYYRDPGDGTITAWPYRQRLLKEYLLGAGADLLCLQECCEPSFESDFAFLREAGYESALLNKGRMRTATFWRTDRWELLSTLHKDRTLVLALRQRASGAGDGGAQRSLFLVNAHLAAGPNADRRLRQAEEALSAAAKEAKKLGLDPVSTPVIFAGDLNSMGRTAVREILVEGEVSPEFRERGDPTEKGQEGKQLTSKARRQTFGRFLDVAEACLGEDKMFPTIVVENIDDKMLHGDGSPTAALLAAVNAAFDRCRGSGAGDELTRPEVEAYLLRVNKALGRGSEFRFATAAMERRGGESLHREDFVALYRAELEEGKFWGVEHDLRLLNGRGLARPEEGPCELCFDHIFFTSSSVHLVAVQQPLSEEQRLRMHGEPWEVLPNSWHPSDHLPVAAVFQFA